MNKKLKDIICICCGSTENIYSNFIEKCLQCMLCGHKWKQNTNVNYSYQKNRLPLLRKTEIQKKIKERYNFINKTSSFKKVLEIGCASGELLKYIKNQNPETFCIGIEPSLDGKERQDGLIIKNIYFDTFKTRKKFDLILAFHVFEHVYEIKSFLNKIIRLMAPNALLCIEVPYKTGNSNIFIDPNDEHFHQFSFASFIILVEKLGLRLEKLESGVFESGIYNDSFRVLLKLDNRIKNINEYKEKLNSRIPNPIILYGIGGDFKGYIEEFIDWDKVAYCIDKDENKHKGKIKGRFIKNPVSAIKDKNKILICSYHYGIEMYNYLISLGINKNRIIQFQEIIQN